MAGLRFDHGLARRGPSKQIQTKFFFLCFFLKSMCGIWGIENFLNSTLFLMVRFGNGKLHIDECPCFRLNNGSLNVFVLMFLCVINVVVLKQKACEGLTGPSKIETLETDFFCPQCYQMLQATFDS